MPVQRVLSNHGSINTLYFTVVLEARVISNADCQRILGYLAFALLPVVFVLPKGKTETAPARISLE